ncbi:uncharacterized protein LOC124596413 [Schistocerca americana]|uniref:uncharacterized protein LOC124596413 n=1 Tax=Schistocerca americana TaxID=7009 RepID=UPI001F4F95FD|nr:uncharacterized protein LOC124596413 [Schistocerca americana]
MAGLFGYGREAIRVKVTKCEGVMPREHRKFSVDPQITSFEVLQSILAKAFDIKGDFTVCYRAYDDCGEETYLPLLSDWDLDAAFISASEPCLVLQVDMKPFEESSDEWETPGSADTNRVALSETKLQNRLPGIIMNQVERTFNMVQRALNLVEDQQPAFLNTPPRPPLTDAEFRKFLDPIGQVIQTRELRTVIYLGGIEPSLRKVVWKHILNVYPEGMSGKERMDYMKKKSYEYQSLRDCWKNMVQNGQVTDELAYVTSMVRKDVLRTDRHHKFYAGSDDNQNIASLFNILTTYALNHPTVSYCQGMSDLASPLLVTMGDEAHAYICFCALMRRLQSNFMLDGVTMTLKFQHLAEGLMYYDPEFYAYLKMHQADDLLFCYRWLLLEMKREFAFDDALRMLEVLWSSLSQMPPEKELPLFERRFCEKSPGESPPPISPLLKTPRENAYTKVCALRRQSSAASLHTFGNGVPVSRIWHRPGLAVRQNQSLDETVIGQRNSKVKHQGQVKLFASLDDSNLQLTKANKSHSTSPNEALSESENDHVNNRINNRLLERTNEVLSGSTGNLLSPQMNEKKSYINDKKQKLLGDKIIFSSFEKINTSPSKDEIDRASGKRIVKNLNEFLSFASLSKNRSHPEKVHDVKQSKLVCHSLQEISPEGKEARNDVPSNDISHFTTREVEELTDTDELLKHEGLPAQVNGLNSDTFCESSSPDDSTEYFPMTTSMTRELRLELENLDRQVFGSTYNHCALNLEDSEDLESPCSESFRSMEAKVGGEELDQRCDCVVSKQESELPSDDTTTEVAEICSIPATPALKLDLDIRSKVSSIVTPTLCENRKTVDIECAIHNLDISSTKSHHFSQACSPTMGTGEEIFVWENPLQCPTTPDEQADLEFDGVVVNANDSDNCFSSVSAGEIFENEGQCIKSITPIRLLRNSSSPLNYQKKEETQSDDASDSSDGWVGSTNSTSHRQQQKSLCTDLRLTDRVSESERQNLEIVPESKEKGSRESFLPAANSTTNSLAEAQEQSSLTAHKNSSNATCVNSSSVLPTVSNLTKQSSPVTKQAQFVGSQLPPPHKFGDGNPFLMFLCLTVLQQHRDFIIRSAMDYNEMAMHFDKMVRKHNVTRVLNHARQMYAAYLRQQATLNNNADSGVDLNV